MTTVSLGEVAMVNPPGDSIQVDEAISFVGMAQLDAQTATALPLETRCFGEVSKGYTVFRDGDVLAAKITPCWENGKVGQAQLDNPIGVGSTEFHVVRPGLELDCRYLLHFLRQPSVRAAGEARMTGSAGQKRVPAAFLRDLAIPLAPLDEQRRIATILDHADALRAKRRHVLGYLDELEGSIFVSMFGHGLELRPVSNLCELVVDCVNRTAPIADHVTPYKMLRTTNVRNGAIDTTNVNFVEMDVFARWNRRATPRPGDVLLTREAPVGEAGVLLSDDQVFLGQRLMLYRVDPHWLTPQYLAACFRSPILQEQFNRLGSGSTVKHLPLPACRNFEIPVAPINLQRRFSQRVAALNDLRAASREQVTAEASLFATLQTRAFRGEL